MPWREKAPPKDGQTRLTQPKGVEKAQQKREKKTEVGGEILPADSAGILTCPSGGNVAPQTPDASRETGRESPLAPRRPPFNSEKKMSKKQRYTRYKASCRRGGTDQQDSPSLRLSTKNGEKRFGRGRGRTERVKKGQKAIRLKKEVGVKTGVILFSFSLYPVACGKKKKGEETG